MRSFAAFLLLAFSFSADAQVDYLLDWEKVGEEATGFLVDLVRIDSSNPPGNETRVAEYLQNVFAGEGIESEMFALDPDRANLVVRYRGNGSKRPILIMGHTDVVGVQAENWSEAPFGGARKDGYVWGRGTLDDKDNVTAGLIVMLLLNRLNVEMDRDVIFLAESGEEGTPEVGITFMVEKHWDKIAAEYAIAEGGNIEIRDGHVHTLAIETTEKAPRRATLVADRYGWPRLGAARRQCCNHAGRSRCEVRALGHAGSSERNDPCLFSAHGGDQRGRYGIPLR